MSVQAATLESITSALNALSIKASAIASHVVSASPEEWKTALTSASDVPAGHLATKTMFFKPKTKSGKPYPVLVVTRADTETNTGALTKAIGQKEMRLAAPELLQEFLGATKDDVSPLNVTKANAPEGSHPLLVVLDKALSTSSEQFSFRAASSDKTIFLNGADVEKYLQSTSVALQIIDFSTLIAPKSGNAALAAPASTSAAAATSNAPAAKDAARIPEAELIGITVRKDGDFADWYQQVLKKGDMLDYYDVSGCYILKPWSYTVWQTIQEFFDGEIKKIGVDNCYFPMFVSSDVLEREKDHIEGFAPEVAWVTRAGSSELEKPVAIRPTSETVMYPYYAKWIRSHRDLPLKLNQWNSVVRWEFKHPQPFLRSREFLWQEGHTAHLTCEGASEEVLHILDLYRQVYEDLLAVPMVTGVKSAKEKFAGSYYSTTLEGFIPTTGRGIQAGTSHNLGQNFSKMFNISVEDPDAKEENRGKPEGRLFVWQNSWGLSTRTIGVMVMVHGDDKGLVMPPRVSQIQAVVIPCGITVKTSPKERDVILDACAQTAKTLKGAGVRAKADLRDNYNPGYKFNDWELRGVPIRIEIGPKDLEKNQVVTARRDTGVKENVPASKLADSIKTLLETIQKDMFNRADEVYRSHRKVVTEWTEFTPTLNAKNHVVIPWCEVESCEDAIKERSQRQSADEAVDERAPSMGAKSLCIPFDQTPYPDISGRKCPQCGEAAKRWTMFGRSY